MKPTSFSTLCLLSCLSMLLFACRPGMQEEDELMEEEDEFISEWEDEAYGEESQSENPYLLGGDPEAEIIPGGLNCERIYLSVDGSERGNKFMYGENIQMNFIDLEGLQLDYDRYTVRPSFLCTELNGDTVLYYPYENEDQYTDYVWDEEVEIYNAISLIFPLESNRKYYFYSYFRDEESGNEIGGKVLIEIKENRAIKMENRGIKFSEMHLWDIDEEVYVTDNYIYSNESYLFGGRNIRGFEVFDGYIDIGMSITMSDDDGEEFYYSGDLYEDDGKILYADVQDELNAEFTVYDTYEWVTIEVRIWDKNTTNSLTISAKLNMADYDDWEFE